ncbi:hypothetical protein FQA39_LY18341 [Lamprigera yunnana]|nr:hypothetical protein FQA39_LY18341 [Lamprigera yunnana]
MIINVTSDSESSLINALLQHNYVFHKYIPINCIKIYLIIWKTTASLAIIIGCNASVCKCQLSVGYTRDEDLLAAPEAAAFELEDLLLDNDIITDEKGSEYEEGEHEHCPIRKCGGSSKSSRRGSSRNSSRRSRIRSSAGTAK